MTKPTLAVTGATGFVGSTLLKAATEAGHKVRALTRRPQPPAPGIEWVEGALDRPDSLKQLAQGADAVIHVAGIVNAPTREGFVAGNITGTQAMVEAARAAGVDRFVHVSSLAARAPDLSVYGWSKAGAEDAVAGSSLDWAMVRPPAIYGPGDMEMLDIFKMAKAGVMLMPPRGHMSVIHAEDLSRLLLALATPGTASGTILEADDARPDGWTHGDFAKAVADAVGRRALILSTPQPILKLGSTLDRMVRGDKAKLTADRVNYFCHPDWRVTAAKRPSPSLWTPQIDTQQGLKDTARAYREAGLL